MIIGPCVATDLTMRKQIEDERARPHRHRDMGKDRVQWMPEPFPLQKMQQRLHRTELPSYLSSHRAIGMWVLDFDVTPICSCSVTVLGCRSNLRLTRERLPHYPSSCLG